LKVLDPKPVEIPPFIAHIGSYASAVIEYDNPLNETVHLSVKMPQSQSFQLLGQITCEPTRQSNSLLQFVSEKRERRPLLVVFWPNKLGLHEKCELQIGNDEIGWITYILQGKGLEPNDIHQHRIQTEFGTASPWSINFQNPFLERCSLNVNLYQEGTDFRLMSLSKVVLLKPMEEMTLEALYQPQRMDKCVAKIELESETGIRWVHHLEVRFF
jgi:hypothetical protein